MIGSPSMRNEDYLASLTEPGKFPVVPPLQNGQHIDRVIPFAATCGSMLGQIASLNKDGKYTLAQPGTAPYRYLLFGCIPAATTFGIPKG